MSASEKVAVTHALWRQGWALTVAGVRARHPDWTRDQVNDAVRAIFRAEHP
jgi:hypothetical protein